MIDSVEYLISWLLQIRFPSNFNQFSSLLQVRQYLIMSYCTHTENTTRCNGLNRESDREKDVKVEGDCERQNGILNIPASRNPFFFKL